MLFGDFGVWVQRVPVDREGRKLEPTRADDIHHPLAVTLLLENQTRVDMRRASVASGAELDGLGPEALDLVEGIGQRHVRVHVCEDTDLHLEAPLRPLSRIRVQAPLRLLAITASTRRTRSRPSASVANASSPGTGSPRIVRYTQRNRFLKLEFHPSVCPGGK